MEIIVIASVAFAASMLTFFSGFGLGTILTPVFMVFFPVELAIGLTGIVHFSNSLFKFFIAGKHVDKAILIRFGIPAVIAAFVGSYVLFLMPNQEALFTYEFANHTWSIFPVKLLISILLIFFALMDLLPVFKKWQFGKDKLFIGGLLSGFFGGISGNQGALRSAFLIKIGLTKEAFLSTTIVLSCMVDISRLSIYAKNISFEEIQNHLFILSIATSSAVFGAILGNQLFKKITVQFLQVTVAIMLLLLSVSLGLGFI
jgi:uncharacterized membrane protein YfcA